MSAPLVVESSASSPSNELKRQRARLWIVTLPAMVLPFFASLLYFVLLSDHWIARVIYGGTKFFTIAWPVVATSLILQRRLLAAKAASFDCHWKAISLGLLSGLLIAGLMFGLMAGPMGNVVALGTPNIRNKAAALGFLNHYWVFGLFLALVHSLIEEYYWRWFVFGRLRELVQPATAHGLAALAFSAHHIVVAIQFFGIPWGTAFGALVGVGGAIWSLLYERQRSLVGAWVSHVIADLGILAVGHKLLFGSYV